MTNSLQTLEQLVSELSAAIQFSNTLGYEGISIRVSNELALEIIEKLQNSAGSGDKSNAE